MGKKSKSKQNKRESGFGRHQINTQDFGGQINTQDFGGQINKDTQDFGIQINTQDSEGQINTQDSCREFVTQGFDCCNEDGILYSIISSLTLREAVRTCVLSHRWEHIWTYLPELAFCQDSILDSKTLELYKSSLTFKDKCYILLGKTDYFIQAVNSVLQQHQGHGRIHKLFIRYFLHKAHSNHLDAWVRYAVASKAKVLYLHLKQPHSKFENIELYDFPLHLLASSAIEKLYLVSCNLKPPYQFDGLNRLTELVTWHGGDTGEDINHLVSHCCSLERLDVVGSKELVTLNIPHSLSQLETLVLQNCEHLKEIRVNAVNLRYISYKGAPVDFLIRQPSCVKIARIYFNTEGNDHNLNFYLTKLANELPHLKKLYLNINGDSKVESLPKCSPSFSHLSRLVWDCREWSELDCQEGNDGVKMSLLHLDTLLDAAPILEELKLHEKYQEKMMECKDTRMKATSEILRNMRILKLQGWEMKFLDKIMQLRKNESNWLKKYVYTSAMTTFVFWGSPTFVAVATFGACMLMGIPLESGKVLSALATFRVLQEPIYNLPDVISMIVQTKVSLDRISAFLTLEDLESDIVQKLPRGSSEIAIEVSNGNFSWDHSSEMLTLKELNFQVLHGMRVAVCGTVGSGKTSLLSCILGEIPKLSGIVKVCGSTAFVAQTPWIQSGLIQDNILFGKEMDEAKYERVLEACSLKKDLEILSFGDKTIIGERGINLSGGQKQRIQIARALYHDADIFMFDDPFSAVDAHTGSHLFKECLLGILASKTVIYVTHQVEFLPSADVILVMKDGKITQAGKYADILNSGKDFMELVGAHKDALAVLDSMELDNGSPSNVIENGLHEFGSSSVVLEEDKKDVQNGKVDEAINQKGQLVQEEEREKGKVGIRVYWRYLTMTYRGALVLVILLAQILFQVLQIGSNFWMTWASPASKDIEPPVSGPVLIYIFVALALASSLCVLVRTLLAATVGYKTATLLFNKMHTCIFRAPMSFFDSTPSGRILNRASTDQSDVDTTIPYQITLFAASVIQLLGIIAVMSQVAWQVFIIFIPVIAACIWYQQYYIDTARELARLVGVCKAPSIQHFAETLSGSVTIRSFNQESRFVGTNFHLSDEFSRPKFYNASAREWLCFRLDMLSTITFAFSLVFLISVPKGVIDPGLAGLAVTYGLNLNTLQASVIWNLCNIENRIISVERILQYMSIPGEPPLTVETKQPDSSNWPSIGEVDLHDVQVRYAPHLPFVLRGLTCTFHGGKKTGIVGRTGSGKSTLIQALFRIVDSTVGRILIDGIDISTIGLHDLRFRLSIIPQDPTMFEGTVRNNLDPLNEYTDEQIWEALDCCQLGEEVRKKELKLDSAVTENGENWSVGQRQLVCLGRITLKKSKVLVLDEATASVDTATDSLIQKTLRQQFSDSTVITIAHRITSVIGSDMVLLLDNGLIVEHDSPTRLLENRSSLFSKLVSEYTVRSSSNFMN